MANFKINQSIAFMKNNKVTVKNVTGISTYQGKINELHKSCDLKDGVVDVIYHCGTYCEVKESEAFNSVDELKQSLFSNIEKE